LQETTSFAGFDCERKKLDSWNPIGFTEPAFSIQELDIAMRYPEHAFFETARIGKIPVNLTL
jgi:hypothetical protein